MYGSFLSLFFGFQIVMERVFGYVRGAEAVSLLKKKKKTDAYWVVRFFGRLIVFDFVVSTANRQKYFNNHFVHCNAL